MITRIRQHRAAAPSLALIDLAKNAPHPDAAKLGLTE
jgi:hypothetical protein